MAQSTTEITREVLLPPATSGEEPRVVDVVLPPGLENFDQPTTETPSSASPSSPTPPAPVPAVVPVAPAPPPAAAVPPVEPPKETRLPPAAREERRKRKYWRGVADKALSELAVARERLGLRMTLPEAKIDPKDLEAARTRAEEAGTGGAIAEVTLQAAERLFGKWQKDFLDNLDGHLRQRELRVQEVAFRRDHPDYDEVGRESGVFAACQILPSGQFANPAIGNQIYFDETGNWRANPIEAGYELGKAIREARRDEPDDNGGEPASSSPAPSSTPTTTTSTPPPPPVQTTTPSPTPTPAPPVPVPASAEAIAEAERRGGQQVTQRVLDVATRPKGLMVLRNAGGGPVQVGLNEDFAKFLDDWDRRNPIECGRFLTANPPIKRWWLGG